MKATNRIHLHHLGILAIIFAFTILGSWTKNIIYFLGTIQEEMDKAVENSFDGMIVYVNQAGKSMHYSAGFNNRENHIPADPHSLFKIASISKLYLVASASRLAADKKLSLNVKLSDVLPEVEGKIAYAKEITLEMMLQHRSGIRDYGFEPETEGETFDDYMSFMARVYDKDAKFKPNSFKFPL